MNLLKNTKCYLIGSMEYKDGRNWRDKVTDSLKEINIKCFNPYKKPFTHGIDESPEYFEYLKELREKGEYSELSKKCKEFRVYDLNLVDRSDFIIFNYNPNVVTVGSFEEFFWANRLKKPIFLNIEGGKKRCPLWLFGTINHKYMYESLDDLINMLYKIDDGEKEIDSDRWRLLKEEFR